MKWSPREFRADTKRTSAEHVCGCIGIPDGVSTDLVANWVSKRRVLSDQNRETTFKASSLEFTRFVEMVAGICDATYVNFPGHPPKLVDGKKSLRKCWSGDGLLANSEKFAWMLYWAPVCGHKRFREGRDWATWKEACFMKENGLSYGVGVDGHVPRTGCIKKAFVKKLNVDRTNVLTTVGTSHGNRIQLENPRSGRKQKGPDGVPPRKAARESRKNAYTFYYYQKTTNEWTEVRTSCGMRVEYTILTFRAHAITR
jgi:hypothetical protein